MKKIIVAVVTVLSLVLMLGGEAMAKAGKNSSMGSRGSRTEDRPIERSLTPQPPAAKAAPVAPVQQQPLASPQPAPMAGPMMQPQPAMGAAAMQQPGFFQRNPFVTGMLGGLVGAGIGSMLFGGSSAMAAANEAAPMASMLGTLMQIALIAGLGWMLFRMFRRKAQPQPEAYGAMDRSAYSPQPSLSVPASAAPRVEREFEAAAADFDVFTTIVTGVQKAWSEGDLVSLRKLATLEVVGWMSEDLAADQSRGVRNVVEDVTLQKGDVTESWREDGREYLTARISFSCRDYMVRLDNGQVVEGNPKELVTHTELWTFLRSGDNGQWLLTAIEQV